MIGKRVTLFAMVMVMLAALWSVSTAAAHSLRPYPRHAPQCALSKPGDNVLLQVECKDEGGDINDAFIAQATVPLEYEVRTDGETASIWVFKLPPSPDREPVIEFLWCVTDLAGSKTCGKYSNRSRLASEPFSGAWQKVATLPTAGVAIEFR